VDFEAGDVQRIVNIPKHRFDYLATKVGISPDVAEIKAKGCSQRHSFRNLLQFAFAHAASRLGLSPCHVRNLLKALAVDLKKYDIFDPQTPTNLSLHIIGFREFNLIIAGEIRLHEDLAQNQFWTWNVTDPVPELLFERTSNAVQQIFSLETLGDVLSRAETCMSINFGRIKANVVNSI
jgi:hypothetical protein